MNDFKITPPFQGRIPPSVPAGVETVKSLVLEVARGVCNFRKKFTSMQDAGAVGASVLNFVSNGNQLATMMRNDSKVSEEEISIPSVMISFQSTVTFAPCVNGNTINFNSKVDERYGYVDLFLTWFQRRSV